MTVIINELEVTAQAEPPTQGPPDSPARRPAPPGLTPLDVRAVLRHLSDRADRVRAD